MPTVRISICICSCQRPEPLRTALSSLARIQVPPGTQTTVTVVDNDPARSAKSVVTGLAESFPLPLSYRLEPRRGIPFARNMCIQEAHKAEADYLVFIDDDEWVEADWLLQLYGYARSVGGTAIISGKVVSQLPPDADPNLSKFFKRKHYKTGKRRRYCATNNVLIPTTVTRDQGLRFDEGRPFAGGEDTLFFTEATARGFSILSCAEAVVYEGIPASRLSLRWLSRRKYTVGITQAVQKEITGQSRVKIITSGFAQLVVALPMSFGFFLLGQKLKCYRSWLKACRSAGIIGGVLGAEASFYRVIDK